MKTALLSCLFLCLSSQAVAFDIERIDPDSFKIWRKQFLKICLNSNTIKLPIDISYTDTIKYNNFYNKYVHKIDSLYERIDSKFYFIFSNESNTVHQDLFFPNNEYAIIGKLDINEKELFVVLRVIHFGYVSEEYYILCLNKDTGNTNWKFLLAGISPVWSRDIPFALQIFECEIHSTTQINSYLLTLDEEPNLPQFRLELSKKYKTHTDSIASYTVRKKVYKVVNKYPSQIYKEEFFGSLVLKLSNYTWGDWFVPLERKKY